MTKEKIAQFKERLEKDRQKLLGEIRDQERPEDFGSDIDGSDEETDEAENLGNRLAVSQTLKIRLNEIDAALNKIELATYGVCVRCGKEISLKVLEVAPESALCESCKKSS